jgi:hypothetical protein
MDFPSGESSYQSPYRFIQVFRTRLGRKPSHGNPEIVLRTEQRGFPNPLSRATRHSLSGRQTDRSLRNQGSEIARFCGHRRIPEKPSRGTQDHAYDEVEGLRSDFVTQRGKGCKWNQSGLLDLPCHKLKNVLCKLHGLFGLHRIIKIA